jgi:hypothetical protein
MKRGDERFYPKCITCGAVCPIGTRKCGKCRKQPTKVVKGKDVRKGSNARGTCLHKPDKPRTKRAKRQYTGGLPPVMAKTQW